MNRRDLLKNILKGAPAILALPVIPIFVKPIPLKDDFVYKGWKVQWQDWIPMFNQDVMVGRWAAYSTHPGDWHLAASWPGACQAYRQGQILDLSWRKNQEWPLGGAMTQEKKVEYKEKNWMRLKKLIDQVGPPPLKGHVCLEEEV